jgi:pimeloyl-ACP methyl ester carboxylesterase
VISGSLANNKGDSAFYVTEIVLKTSTGNIYGTLTITRHAETSPLVIIIPGSGQTDRDCNSIHGMQTNAYKMLAENLARIDVSSLRFDKRGVGKSKAALGKESELKFDTYVNDVIGWISLLKSYNLFSKIILLGHGEGSLVGILAAARTNVTAFISVEGAGKTIDKVLLEQIKRMQPKLLNESAKIIDSLKAGRTVPVIRADLLSVFRPGVQPYLISCMKYDPSKEISKLNVPVLLLHGNSDLQVNPEDAVLLSKALPRATLLFIDNMNHIMKESGLDVQKNLATYKDPKLPLELSFVNVLTTFIMALN